MRIRIEEIQSKKMFPGLIIGKPKQESYEESLAMMKNSFKENRFIHNLSKVEFKNEGDYITYGNITGVKIRIVEGYDNYDFVIIFNFYPGLETLENSINSALESIDWRNNSFKWDIGDL